MYMISTFSQLHLSSINAHQLALTNAPSAPNSSERLVDVAVAIGLERGAMIAGFEFLLLFLVAR
jgi:hypothetical protein